MMFAPSGCVQIVLAVVLAPLMLSIINRTKAFFAGRHGPPWLQPYHDLRKLLYKSAVYSRTTTWVFIAGPLIGCGACLTALLFLPVAGSAALFSFSGDFLLVAYLLGLGRFFTVLAAWDTGSSFEGMGASREVCFSALAEPPLILSVTALAICSHHTSLSGIYGVLGTNALALSSGPAVLLVALALMVVFLAENARIPVDDPNTHLELTMIHEVMVLDHSGPDLAMIQYGACLKLWTIGWLLVGILAPAQFAWYPVNLLAGLVGMGLLGVTTGIVESVMARLRLVRVPQFLIAASVLAILALVLMLG
ncbi:MAG: respiratory chain complex I subunit 1 family protein [Pirellulaceae bacterium]